MKVKEESEKVGLMLNFQETKIMASDPITSWQINWETVETVSDFILGGSQITADGDCSQEIQRRLLLGRTPGFLFLSCVCVCVCVFIQSLGHDSSQPYGL